MDELTSPVPTDPANAPVEQARPIRLVALDLDGTLLSSRKTILPHTHTVLRAILERGVKVVLATARPPRSVRPYYRALKLDTPSIHYNGGLIWNEGQRKVLTHSPLEPDVVERVVKFARDHFPDIVVSVEILDKWYTDHYADIPEYQTETAKHFSPDFVGPLEAFIHVPATKLMLLGKQEWISELELLLTKAFGEAVAHTRSDAFLLQVMAPGVSKGVALRQLAGQMGIRREEILAVGDAPNDLDMVQYAGTGVAMGNGWPEVKNAATWTAPGNDDDGVAAALERFVLRKRVVTSRAEGARR